MEIIKTTTRSFLSDYAIVDANIGLAYIRILNTSADDLRSVFGDVNETATIQIGNRVLTGYTKLVVVLPETDAIKVVMEKE